MNRILPCVLGVMLSLLWTSSSQAQPEKEATYEGKTIRQWLRLLETTKSSGERLQACTVLGKSGQKDDEVVLALTTASKDTNEKVRIEAARALVELGFLKQALPAMIAALKGETIEPQAMLVWDSAMSKIDSRSTDLVPQLTGALKTKDKVVLIYATMSLTKIGLGAKDSAPALLTVLRNEESAVRSLAALALGEVAPFKKEVVTAVTDALQDEAEVVRFYALFAITRIGSGAKEATPILIRLLRGKEAVVRAGASRALGKIGPAAKIAIPSLMEMLEDSEGGVRLEAVNALGSMGPLAKDAVGPLGTRSRIDVSDEIREAAVKALKLIQSK